MDDTNPPAEAVARAETEGLKEGVFAGLTSGLASGLIGAKFFKFDRTRMIASVVLTSALSGYYFTLAFRAANLRSLDIEFARSQEEKRAGVDYSKPSNTPDDN